MKSQSNKWLDANIHKLEIELSIDWRGQSETKRVPLPDDWKELSDYQRKSYLKRLAVDFMNEEVGVWAGIDAPEATGGHVDTLWQWEN